MTDFDLWMPPSKWCSHCLKFDHSDNECWSTRVVELGPMDRYKGTEPLNREIGAPPRWPPGQRTRLLDSILSGLITGAVFRLDMLAWHMISVRSHYGTVYAPQRYP